MRLAGLGLTLREDELSSKILLAILGAVLGLATGLLLERIKARREPKRQLSWDASVDRATISVQEGVQEKVKVLYAGTIVDELVLLKVRVTNTGNRVVKNTQLRFVFDFSTRVLESFHDPEPDEEMGVVETSAEGTTDRRFRIGHLERDQAVAFQFVLTGPRAAEDWKIRSFNQEGDVVFQRRDVAKERADQEHLRPFLLLAFLLLTLPPVASRYIEDQVFAAMLGTVILFFMAPHLVPVIRIAESLVARAASSSSRRPATPTVNVWGGGRPNIAFLEDARVSGDVKLTTTPAIADDEQESDDDAEPPEIIEDEARDAPPDRLYDLKSGEIVHHASWGQGTVEMIRGEHDKLQVRVIFPPPVGTRWLLVKYAPLQRMTEPETMPHP
jgi:hypothetical protein